MPQAPANIRALAARRLEDSRTVASRRPELNAAAAGAQRRLARLMRERARLAASALGIDEGKRLEAAHALATLPAPTSRKPRPGTRIRLLSLTSSFSHLTPTFASRSLRW